MRRVILVVLLVSLASVGRSFAQGAERLQELLGSGGKKYDHSDFQGALADWEEGLELATKMDRMVKGSSSAIKSVIAKFSLNIGNVHYSLSDYPKALDYYERALKIDRDTGDKKGVADNLGNIGIVYGHLGDYPEALDYYQQALKIMKEIPDSDGVANNLGNIGIVYLHQGDYPEALDYFQSAIKLKRETRDRLGLGNNLANLGDAYLSLGDYPKALEYYEQAFKIHRGIGNKKAQGAILGNIGVVYARLGDYPNALDSFRATLKIRRDIPDREGESTDLGNIGAVHLYLGDHPKALDCCRQALKLAMEIGDKRGGLVNLGCIGDSYLAQKNFEAAHDVYARLGDGLRMGLYYLASGEYGQAKETLNKRAAAAKESREAETVLAALTGLGLALEQLGELRPSRGAFSQAIAKIERQRDMLPLAARANFLSAKDHSIPRIAAYEGRARVAESPADGFYWSENTKARLFIEALAAGTGKTSAIPQDLAMKEAELAGRMASLYKQEDAAFEKNNKKRLAALKPEIARTTKEQASFVAKLRRDHPEYAAIQYPQPFKPGELALEPGEALLEYEVTGSKTLLFVVTADKQVFSFDIPVTRDELRKLVVKFRKPFESPLDKQGRFKGAFAAVAGAELYKLLLKPVFSAKDPRTGRPLLSAKSRLIIVPDEVLGLLSFEALNASAEPKGKEAPTRAKRGLGFAAPEGLRYVGDIIAVSYAQSATTLTLARTLRKGRASGAGFFVLADPVFGRADERLKGAEVKASGYTAQVQSSVVKFMGVKGVKGDAAFERLKQTGALAGNIERAFGDEVAILEGREAREGRLKESDLDRYRYLVFATHGILDTDVPYIREPALVLSQVGNAEDEDGFLTMSEVMGLKLKADVAALTACKTGMGRQVSGEGVMGLGRAFQYAGAKNVLVSLWSVDEESTTMLTEEFFRMLKDGRTPREALKASRAKVRSRKEYDHPFFWAPFILMGE